MRISLIELNTGILQDKANLELMPPSGITGGFYLV